MQRGNVEATAAWAQVAATYAWMQPVGLFSSLEIEETLLEVREGKQQSVKFLVKDSNGGSTLNELLLLVGGEDEDFVLLSFIGNIDLSQVGKLSKAFEDKNENKGSKKN